MAEKIVFLSSERTSAKANGDLAAGLCCYPLWLGFAWHDIRQRFRRSVLGPFWLTISTAATAAALSLVYSSLFPTPLETLLPYLATGLVVWALINSSIVEGCEAFVWSERWIKNVPMPLSIHLLRLLARNVIVWAHNMIIVVLLLVIFPPRFGAAFLLWIPGLAILLVNLFWISLVLSLVCARYRDVTQIVASVMQVVFFITPIFWSTRMTTSRVSFVDWNPFYHLVEIVRAPLLGGRADDLSWLISIGLPLFGMPLAVRLYQKAHSRVAYWV